MGGLGGRGFLKGLCMGLAWRQGSYSVWVGSIGWEDMGAGAEFLQWLSGEHRVGGYRARAVFLQQLAWERGAPGDTVKEGQCCQPEYKGRVHALAPIPPGPPQTDSRGFYHLPGPVGRVLR